MKLLARYKDHELAIFAKQALDADPRIDSKHLRVTSVRGVITVTTTAPAVRGGEHIPASIKRGLSRTEYKYDRIVNQAPAAQAA